MLVEVVVMVVREGVEWYLDGGGVGAVQRTMLLLRLLLWLMMLLR